MRTSKALQAEIDERRTKLIKLRRTKTPFGSQKVLDLGYSSEAVARKDFYRAVMERKDATEAQVAAYREEQNEVIEALLETYLPLAINEKDIKAAEMVLKLLERQSKLNGWESALKAEVSGPGGGPVAVRASTITELQKLIRTAGDPDAEDDDLDDVDNGEDTDDDGTA